MRVRSRSRLAWSLAAAGLFASHSAAAQDINLTAKAGQEASARHPRGTYMGVKPGGNEAPGLNVKPGQTPATVTWPGFQMQADGSSRVFLQTTVPVDPNVTAGGNRVVVDLGDAQIVGPRANRLPFYTQYFNTPVTSVELVRERKGKGKSKRTLLVIKLRADVQPRVSSEVAPSGFNFVYFDFPAGQYLANAPPSMAAGAPPPQADASVLNQPPPAPSDPPTHLDGEINTQGAVSTPSSAASARMNAELPPGMGKTKSKAKAGFSVGR
jgi:hypothetical protein